MPRRGVKSDVGGAKSAKISGAQTLDRGLLILEELARDPSRLPDLARSQGLAISTTNRLVKALESRRLVSVRKGILFTGPKLIQLGQSAYEVSDLIKVADPFVRELSAKTSLCAFLGGRDGNDSIHLLRHQGQRRVIVSTPVGKVMPLAATSIGKALMLDADANFWRDRFEAAHLPYGPEIEAEMLDHQNRGVVIHRGHFPDRIRAAAAPVRDEVGRIVAAVSVATVAQYIEDKELLELGHLVVACANEISSAHSA